MPCLAEKKGKTVEAMIEEILSQCTGPSMNNVTDKNIDMKTQLTMSDKHNTCRNEDSTHKKIGVNIDPS